MERLRFHVYLWLLVSAFVVGLSLPLEKDLLIRNILSYGGGAMSLMLVGWMITDILIRRPGRPTRETAWRCLFWVAVAALVDWIGFILYFLFSRGWKGLLLYVAFVLSFSLCAWLGAGVSFVIQNLGILFT